jgi:ribosomal protein S21
MMIFLTRENNLYNSGTYLSVLDHMARFYATKKEGESSDKMLVRFKKLLYGSRLITDLRARRYNKKDPTRRKVREQAIVCSRYRELSDELS